MARPLVLPEIAKSTAKVLKNNDIAIFKLRNLKVVARLFHLRLRCILNDCAIL